MYNSKHFVDAGRSVGGDKLRFLTVDPDGKSCPYQPYKEGMCSSAHAPPPSMSHSNNSTPESEQ